MVFPIPLGRAPFCLLLLFLYGICYVGACKSAATSKAIRRDGSSSDSCNESAGSPHKTKSTGPVLDASTASSANVIQTAQSNLTSRKHHAAHPNRMQKAHTKIDYENQCICGSSFAKQSPHGAYIGYGNKMTTMVDASFPTYASDGMHAHACRTSPICNSNERPFTAGLYALDNTEPSFKHASSIPYDQNTSNSKDIKHTQRSSDKYSLKNVQQEEKTMVDVGASIELLLHIDNSYQGEDAIRHISVLRKTKRSIPSPHYCPNAIGLNKGTKLLIKESFKANRAATLRLPVFTACQPGNYMLKITFGKGEIVTHDITINEYVKISLPTNNYIYNNDLNICA